MIGDVIDHHEFYIADNPADFLVAIPEPSTTAALIGLGGIPLILRRRE